LKSTARDYLRSTVPDGSNFVTFTGLFASMNARKMSASTKLVLTNLAWLQSLGCQYTSGQHRDGNEN
jgi:hypothetical protein